jgi:hypothetical protein
MAVIVEPEDPVELEADLRAGHMFHINIPRVHSMVAFYWEPRSFQVRGGETQIRKVFVLEKYGRDQDQVWTYEDDKFEEARAHWALLKRGIAPQLAEWIIDNF